MFLFFVTTSASDRNKWQFSFYNVSEKIGTKDVNKEAKVSKPKDKKNAPAGESVSQRPKRRKEKLIRLDDLIPKENVVGGRQLLFGATDITETINPKQES